VAPEDEDMTRAEMLERNGSNSTSGMDQGMDERIMRITEISNRFEPPTSYTLERDPTSYTLDRDIQHPRERGMGRRTSA